jgi:DNA-binding GntR family transcriptional regulator
MEITRVKSISLSQQAYRKLREKILNNELRPGRFFLEKELAALLGISRTPPGSATTRF